MAAHRLPTYYLSHGGGPWPWMKAENGATYDKLEASLVSVRHELGDAPRAILVISGHWTADRFKLSSSERPPTVYDYHGFPEHTYRIRYAAPGAPEIAEQVRAMLEAGGIGAGLDPAQGFDHGTFSLMQPIYPEAMMPVVQLSVRNDFAPETHLKVGELLAPLREQGVVVVGSGSSFHDIRGMIGGAGAKPSVAFDAWLADTLLAASPDERRRKLAHWTAAPSARAAHPNPDHLLPLMVAVGAAGADQAHRIFHQDDFMGTISLSSFRFGDPVTPTTQIQLGEAA